MNNKKAIKKPLSDRERSRLAYLRKTENHNVIKITVLKTTREKLKMLVEDFGGTQNQYFEWLINKQHDESNMGK